MFYFLFNVFCMESSDHESDIYATKRQRLIDDYATKRQRLIDNTILIRENCTKIRLAYELALSGIFSAKIMPYDEGHILPPAIDEADSDIQKYIVEISDILSEEILSEAIFSSNIRSQMCDLLIAIEGDVIESLGWHYSTLNSSNTIEKSSLDEIQEMKNAMAFILYRCFYESEGPFTESIWSLIQRQWSFFQHVIKTKNSAISNYTIEEIKQHIKHIDDKYSYFNKNLNKILSELYK